MINKNTYILTFFFLLVGISSYSQEVKKDLKGKLFGNNNKIEVAYDYLDVDTRSNNSFSGSGFQLSYTRNIYKNFYAGISWGKIYASTPNNYNDLLWLNSETTLKKWEIGLGYVFYNRKKIQLSGEVNYLGIFYNGLLERISSEDGADVQYELTGKSFDETIQAQIQIDVFLYRNLFLVGKLGYGFGYNNYTSISLKTGLGYRF